MKNNSKKDNFMLYIPEHKHDRWELRNKKVFLIFQHDRFAERLTRWLVKKPYVSDIELDELGSATWQLIDGKNTVYDIAQMLVGKFGEKCQPVNERLIMYLRYLNKKGWIRFTGVRL
ncbi:MAG: PqqD family protein [Pseudomonadota bacterium]